MNHEGRISKLETRVDNIEADQGEDHTILDGLSDAFQRHTTRTLAQIVRQRWDEIMGYLLIAAGASYANQDALWRLWLWAAGAGPDQ
jgi:hypothetical protein